MSGFIYYQTDIDSVFLENIVPVSPTFHHLDNREKEKIRLSFLKHANALKNVSLILNNSRTQLSESVIN